MSTQNISVSEDSYKINKKGVATMKPTPLNNSGIHIITGSLDKIKTQFEKWKESNKDNNIYIVNTQFSHDVAKFSESYTMYITYEKA